MSVDILAKIDQVEALLASLKTEVAAAGDDEGAASAATAAFLVHAKAALNNMTVARPDEYPIGLDERPAVCSLVPPGCCQFGDEFVAVPLLEKVPCGEGDDTWILRFGLPDPTRPMDLSTCACVLAMAELVDNKTGVKGPVVRPYTPISANDQVGSFDLLIRDYGDKGYLSKYMGQDLKVGDMMSFKHIAFNVKIQAPFKQKKIGILAGGTGINPMIQALHAILGEGNDNQASDAEEVSLLYGSRESDAVLGGEMLSEWANSDKFNYVDILSHEPETSRYDGERGFIDKARIEKYLPPASEGDDVIIFVCGPPLMYNLLCGPRDKKEVTGILGEMGYAPEQIFKF